MTREWLLAALSASLILLGVSLNLGPFGKMPHPPDAWEPWTTARVDLGAVQLAFRKTTQAWSATCDNGKNVPVVIVAGDPTGWHDIQIECSSDFKAWARVRVHP